MTLLINLILWITAIAILGALYVILEALVYLGKEALKWIKKYISMHLT